MAMFNLRRFGNPDALKSIQARHLRALLTPHAPFLGRRGVRGFEPTMPCRVAEPAPVYYAGGAPVHEDEGIDYEGLAGVFLNPDDGTPASLVDALYLIHEMSTPEAMEELLDAVARSPDRDRIVIDLSAPTPADVAVQVWLRAPRLLERKHAESFVGERKTFEYYVANQAPSTTFTPPERTTLSALETDLGEWFSSRSKGERVRVFMFPQPDEVWFLVRHGEAFRREGAVKDGRSASVFYRPERHDVLVYNATIGELRINATTKGERILYRRKFGLYLFGSEEHFPCSSRKYALDPLRADGEAALVASDVEGIEAVNLSEVHYFWGGPENEVEIRKAANIFAAFRAREGLLHTGRLIEARFRVKFSNCRKARCVCIRPPNVARFTRDEDGRLVEEWLRKRGFSLTKREDVDEANGPALACA